MMDFKSLADHSRLSEQDLCDIAVMSIGEFPYAVFTVSVPDYRILLLNGAAMDAMHIGGIAGLRSWLGEYPWDMLPWGMDELRPLYDRSLATSSPTRLSDAPVGSGDTTTYWDIIALPSPSPDGVTRSITTVVEDVTSRRQAEIARIEGDRRFERYFDQSPVGAAIVSLDHRFIRVNPALCRITGYSEPELIALGFEGITHPDDFTTDVAQAQDLAAGRIDQYEIDKRYIRGDGKTVWVRLSARLVKEERGNALYYLPMFEDITERKQAEQTILCLNAELESRVVERTIQLEREISEQKRAEAEAARAREKAERAVAREAEARAVVEYQLHLLQRALVPSAPPIVEGYELATAYIPAYEGQEIGGDFFDVFETEDQKVGILLGDVSGKGIEAASLAAATKSTVRAFAYDMSAPGEALSHANSVICSHSIDTTQFVTVFLIVLDPASGEITYASAGHPPALIQRVDGSVDALRFGQPPIGIVGRYDYAERRAELRHGDRMVLYTDGISEARCDSGLFGSEGIERTLCAHIQSPTSGLLAGLLSAVTDWACGHLRDDTAVLIVERK